MESGRTGGEARRVASGGQQVGKRTGNSRFGARAGNGRPLLGDDGLPPARRERSADPCGGGRRRVGKQCSPRQHGRSERLPRPLPEAGAHTRLGGQSVRTFTDSAADDSLPHGRRTCGGRGKHHRRGDSAATGCGSGCHLPAAGHGKQGIRISGAGGH